MAPQGLRRKGLTMAGGGTAEAKRQWLDKYRSLAGAGPAPAAAASPPPAAARGNDTDLMDPNEADAPAAAAPGDDRAPIDPYGDDGAAADDPVTAAATELDAAGKDAAAKTMAEHDAEAALGKAQSDLAAAQANLRDKSDKYYAAQAKAHPAPGIDPNADLPADMLPDCKPEPGKIAGPPEHQLCKTHGHVVNIQSKQIIAHDVADYDKRHPVPRPMESDCKPDPGKLPGAPDHIVMCKPHGHVLDTKAKQIIANSGVLYLKAHPGAAGAAKAKPDAVSGASAPPAGKAAAPGDAGKTGTAPAQSGAKGPATPAGTAKPAGPKKRDGDWDVTVEKWHDLFGINVRVNVRDMREVSYLVYWQYGYLQEMPPPLVHVEFNFSDGLASKELAAPKGPVQMITENGRYDFSGKFTLPDDEAAKEALGVAIQCRIILTGTVSDRLSHMGVIMLQ